MPLWVIKYLLPGLAVTAVILGIRWWFNDQLAQSYTRGETAGLASAKKTCDDETVPAAKKLVQEQCDANTKITTEACNALQTSYDTIDARYNRLLKQASPGKCVAITSAPGRAVQGAGAAVQPMQDPGVEWSSLIGLGRDNDRTAARLATLQSVVCGIYKANKREDILPEGACMPGDAGR